jgi:N-acyl-D-amino-acid deacylase
MFQSGEIARAAGTSEPAMQEAIIRSMLGRPLDFDPGARYAYSNFGYCVLGRVIEKATGTGYEHFMRQKFLAPIGIQRMRIGASLEAGRAPGEVRYYMRNRARSTSVFPEQPGPVPFPYGGFCLEAMDSHGAWLASAADLARFAAALDDPKRDHWLKAKTKEKLAEPPEPPASRRADGSLEDHFYGCGWLVRPVGKAGRANYWHSGSLPGTATLLVRRHDGLSWAAVLNQRSDDRKLPDTALDPALHRAADAVTEWPARDLFPQYF